MGSPGYVIQQKTGFDHSVRTSGWLKNPPGNYTNIPPNGKRNINIIFKSGLNDGKCWFPRRLLKLTVLALFVKNPRMKGDLNESGRELLDRYVDLCVAQKVIIISNAI